MRSGSGGGEVDTEVHRLALLRLYASVDPTRLDKVEAFLEKYKGREGDLWLLLQRYPEHPEHCPLMSLRSIRIHPSLLRLSILLPISLTHFLFGNSLPTLQKVALRALTLPNSDP